MSIFLISFVEEGSIGLPSGIYPPSFLSPQVTKTVLPRNNLKEV